MHDSASATDLEHFIRSHRLPETYAEGAQRWFLPLAAELAQMVARAELRVLGIVGSQGSGKSTLGDLICHLLQRDHGLRVLSLSLDDFYLGREERLRLAKQQHPLLATRGVPGTHDVQLALETIDSLLTEGESAVPRFDKAEDDRRPAADWERVKGPLDLVILEGWCLCAPPEDEASLARPINQLESEEDPQGHWRHYVNQKLAGEYRPLFERIDFLVFLAAPDFDCVYQWRRKQEQKLSASAGKQIMPDEQLARFIQHFERITRDCLASLPERADVVFRLNQQQEVIARHDNQPGA